MPAFRETWLSSAAVTVNGSADKPAETKAPAPADRSGNTTVDSRDFTLSGSGFTMATLADGNKAFSNPGYVWESIPASLRGRRYTQSAGGDTAHLTVHAKHDVVLDSMIARTSARTFGCRTNRISPGEH